MFTLSEYLSGSPIPVEAPKWFYGIATNERGVKHPFVVTAQARVPARTLIAEQAMSGEGAAERVKALLDEDCDDPIESGSLAWHVDQGGCHAAIILDIEGDNCAAVFLTSTTTWNRERRAATNEELALASFTAKRTTYFAPVIRPTVEFVARPVTLFPAQRVSRLFTEFFGVRGHSERVTLCNYGSHSLAQVGRARRPSRPTSPQR